MLQGRTVLFYARATSARRSPQCVKKYARVAYVILCNSVCKVRHNECTHRDKKPPPPIRDGRVYRGKERMYGGKERVQGRRPWWGSRGRSPRREVGAEPPPPHWLNNTFLFWRINENTHRNFTHRPELYASLYASLPYYFTARYFTHDECGE